MRFRPLGTTGLQVSILGFGASPLGNVFGNVPESEAVSAVHCALDNGVSCFDTAPYYGKTLSETRLGALRGRRHEAILATKCGRYGAEEFDFSASRVFSSIDESLRRLQTDYVDILHVHDIEFGDRDRIVSETLPALEEVRRAGKTRFIGITGLSLRMLEEVATAFPVDVVLSYCRYNLLNQDLESGGLGSFCKNAGTGLINASPLHMGLLAEGDPPAWHPAPDLVRAAARQVVELCARRQVDAATLALQFALGNTNTASTLVGIASVAQLEANLRAAEGVPDPDLLAEIEAVTRPVRHVIWSTGKPENH